MSAVLQSLQTAFDARREVGAQQREAFARFLERGLPTTQLDAWKYTDLRRLALRTFRNASPAERTADIETGLLKLDAERLVFVDGAPLTARDGMNADDRGLFDLVAAPIISIDAVGKGPFE